MEATTAVQKPAITNPGTIMETLQRRKALIRNAAIPNVIIYIGSAISWRMGLMKVLTIPITTATTTAVQRPDNLNPGTKYSTIKRANTFRASLTISFIN